MSIKTWSVVHCDECGAPAPQKGTSPRGARIAANWADWRYMRRPIDARGYWDSRMWDLCPTCWAKREKGAGHLRDAKKMVEAKCK